MIDLAHKSLLEKARARPDFVRTLPDKACTEGILSAYQKAIQRLEAPMALSYSSPGIVIAVSEGVTGCAMPLPVRHVIAEGAPRSASGWAARGVSRA